MASPRPKPARRWASSATTSGASRRVEASSRSGWASWGREYSYPGGPSSAYFQAERFGIAPYVEAGVEVLRLHRGRIGLHVRADFPLASLHSQEIEVWSEWDRPGDAPRVYAAQSRYVVPVSIGINVAF